MRFRFVVVVAMLCALLAAGLPVAPASAQQAPPSGAGAQTGGTPFQRVEVMRQRLDALRRSLNSALSATGGDSAAGQPTPTGQTSAPTAAADAAARLRGLVRECDSLLTEVNEIRGKLERSDRLDTSEIDRLEAAVADLNGRGETALRETADTRRGPAAASGTSKKKKQKKGSFVGRLFGRGGGDQELSDLTGTVAPGRDRELFAAGARRARKSDYEGARLLFNVIINTYPESPYLPYAKLAIADTFYLEGTTSALIQGGAAYQDWLTYFPTDPLAERVMIKMAEVEMRQMGLPDRSGEHARKAEQRLRVALQQFPQTSMRPDLEARLRQVQENLAQHNLDVGNFYLDRYNRQLAPNPKGAQSRYREIVEKYPNFSRMAEVLFRLGTTYVQEEEPDEAAKYFQQLVRTHPTSDFAERAKEQLEAIGAAVPAADANAVQTEPQDPGMMSRVWTEVSGRADVTVDKDGVLISRDSKATNDLIDQALANGGLLTAQSLTGPTPSPRILATPRPAPPQPTPAQPQGSGLQTQPTRPGPPATGSDPTKPANAIPPPGA